MRIIFLMLSILSTTLSQAQDDINRYEELVIVDYQNWSYNRFYGRTYVIKLKESPAQLYDMKLFTGMELLDQLKTSDHRRWEKINSLVTDSIERYFEEVKRLKEEYKPIPEAVRQVDQATIERLKREMARIVPRDKILIELEIGKDSIKENLSRYLKKFLIDERIEYKPEKLNYCMDKLSDYELFRRMAMSITHGQATEDYPTVSIALRNSSDTLELYTHGQHSFMLPWLDQEGKEYSYNPSLSKEIAELLPHFNYSNRERLLGNRSIYGDYVSELYYLTIRSYCIDRKNRLITR